MALKPIVTEADHAEALARIDELMDAAPDSAGEAELEALSILVEAYETKHYPISPPHPVEAIRFAMEQQGVTQKDLVSVFGSSGRVSEVLGKKRSLTLPMIRRASAYLGVEPGVLIKKYNLKPGKRRRSKMKRKRRAQQQPTRATLTK